MTEMIPDDIKFFFPEIYQCQSDVISALISLFSKLVWFVHAAAESQQVKAKYKQEVKSAVCQYLMRDTVQYGWLAEAVEEKEDAKLNFKHNLFNNKF